MSDCYNPAVFVRSCAENSLLNVEGYRWSLTGVTTSYVGKGVVVSASWKSSKDSIKISGYMSDLGLLDEFSWHIVFSISLSARAVQRSGRSQAIGMSYDIRVNRQKIPVAQLKVHEPLGRFPIVRDPRIKYEDLVKLAEAANQICH